MRFTNINPTGSEWRWCRFRDTDLELELRCATTDDIARLAAWDMTKGTAEQRKFIAESLFRNFRGAADAAGQPLSNTVQNRGAVLMAPPVWRFTVEQLVVLSEATAEGNGDGAAG